MKKLIIALLPALLLLSSCKPDVCDCLDSVGAVSLDGLKEMVTGEEMKDENEACWEELNQYKLTELMKIAKECRKERKQEQ